MAQNVTSSKWRSASSDDDQPSDRGIGGQSPWGKRSADDVNGASGRRNGRKYQRPRKQSAIKRVINRWCNRLLGVVTEGSFDQEEEFESHRTSRDYICNTIGTGVWGVVFPALTIVVTQLSGVEQAGMFSMAFIIGTLLMIIGNYGVRTYQVSDIGEAHSFFDYQVNRWITCIVMMLVAYVYCSFRGYDQDMFTICMAVCTYKMVDGLADVYEGRLQQMDKLYLAGISQAFRSIVVLVLFSIVLLVTRNLVFASIVMAVAAIVTFVLLTFPLAQLETPRSRGHSLASVAALFKQCFPVFIALFMYALIDNMPKFVMEGVLSYDNQLYFNALYFPAQAILLTVGSIYKPMLVRMAQMWADAEKRRRFDIVILAIVGVVIALTLIVIFVMGWIGIPIMSFMYGVDFEQFRGLSYIMIAAGGVTAIIDFLYQVITVLRRQKSVMKLYVITFGFALFVPILLIDFTGLPGAVIGYLIVMTILLVLLVWEYISIRIDLHRHPERVEAALAGEEAAARAYEERAERNARRAHAQGRARARQGAAVRERNGVRAARSRTAQGQGVPERQRPVRSVDGSLIQADNERPLQRQAAGQVVSHVGTRSSDQASPQKILSPTDLPEIIASVDEDDEPRQ
ncbi:MAG: lipopolysaccharide biosynthesis protein [Eggerthellaceae bacterium]